MSRVTLLPGRDVLIDAAATLALLMVSLWAFRSSYGGVAFMVVGLISAFAGIAVAWVSLAKRWPPVVTAAAALVVYVLLSTWLALRHYALLGIIPTPQSMLESVMSPVAGWKELITTVPPVGSTGDLMVIPVFLSFFGGLLTFSVARAWRYVAPALVFPLAITGLGIVVGINTPVSLVVNGVVLAVLMVGWVAWHEDLRRPAMLAGNHLYRRLAMSASLLAVAAALGFLLAPHLPGGDGPRAIWRQTVTPPFDPRVYPSPLAGYRDYVKRGYDAKGEPRPDREMFTIEGLPEGVPVRLATMDTYDGLVWQVSGGDPEAPSLYDSGSFERIGARLDPDVEGERATVTITIGAYADVWVPDVGEVISLKFDGSAGGSERDRALNDSFRYNRSSDTAATPLRLSRGDRYVMEVRLPNLLAELADQPIVPTVENLGQARSVPEVTQTLATPDLLQTSDSGRRLDTIRELMVTTGAYSDGDRQANQILVTAGHSASRMVAFVGDFPRRPFIGDAEQFSSAFALLFRDLGNVPTRVVMGFKPSESSVDAAVKVVQTDVEAWVEVPVDGLGWVPIFPTPPRDQLKSKKAVVQQAEPNYRTQNPPPPPLVDPEYDEAAKAKGKAQNPVPAPEESAVDNEPLEKSAGLLPSPATRRKMLLFSPLVLVTLVAISIVLIKLGRRRRRRRRGATHQRIANGWREVTDLSTDLGRPVPATNTRREAAAFVGRPSVALAERTDDAVWSGAELTDADVAAYWQELSATLRSIRSDAPWHHRIRSYFSIQSLKRRRQRGQRD